MEDVGRDGEEGQEGEDSGKGDQRMVEQSLGDFSVQIPTVAELEYETVMGGRLHRDVKEVIGGNEAREGTKEKK